MFAFAKNTKSLIVSAVFASCFAASASAQIWRLDSWASYGESAHRHQQSTCGDVQKVLWSTPVDLDPQYGGSELFIHYAVFGELRGRRDGYR